MYTTIVLQAGGTMGNFILIPAMLLVIYLFMIRPQMKRSFSLKLKKEQK